MAEKKKRQCALLAYPPFSSRCDAIRQNMLSIRLKPRIEERLTRLAKMSGSPKTFLASKLIEGNLEEIEDRYLAEARLEKHGRTYRTTGLLAQRQWLC
jgi:predicted DNA-binding protein